MQEVTSDKKVFLNISKVMSSIMGWKITLRKEDENPHVMNVITLPKKDIYVRVELSNNADNSSEEFNEIELDQLDWVVLDTVYTMAKNRVKVFSIEAVARELSGSHKRYVSKERVEKVAHSLEKLRSVYISIQCEDEFNHRKIRNFNSDLSTPSPLLPIKDEQVLSNNHIYELKGYRLVEMPALYAYAGAIKQIASVPENLLNVKGLVETYDTIFIKKYLARRIATMKNEKNNLNSNRISYSWYDYDTDKDKGMLYDLGFDKMMDTYSNWYKKKSNIHKNVLRILDSFKTDEYIKDYQEVREDAKHQGTIKGVDIIL